MVELHPDELHSLEWARIRSGESIHRPLLVRSSAASHSLVNLWNTGPSMDRNTLSHGPMVDGAIVCMIDGPLSVDFCTISLNDCVVRTDFQL